MKDGVTKQAGARRIGQTLQRELLRGAPLIALLLLAAYLSLASPYFFTGSNLANVSRQSSITAILAVGQTFVILAAGIDLSIVAIAALSASLAAVLMTQQFTLAGVSIGPVDFWVGVVIALLAGAGGLLARFGVGCDKLPLTAAQPGLIVGDPRELILKPEDISAELTMQGGESRHLRTYSVVMFNPRAFSAAASDDPDILGVIADLAILDGVGAARVRFAAQGGLGTDTIAADVLAQSPDAQVMVVEPVPFEVAGCDLGLAFRVHYVLQGVDVYEHRYRMQLSNALSNIIVSIRATADGSEPSMFLKSSVEIATSQIKRLRP